MNYIYFRYLFILHRYIAEDDRIEFVRDDDNNKDDWRSIPKHQVAEWMKISVEDLKEYVLSGNPEGLMYIKLKYNVNLTP